MGLWVPAVVVEPSFRISEVFVVGAHAEDKCSLRKFEGVERKERVVGPKIG